MIDTARTKRHGFLRTFFTRPLAAISAGWIVLISVACAGAAVFAPYSPYEQDLQITLQGPSFAHLLGTDALGRDVLSRLLWGGQPALSGALQAVVVVVVLGVVGGLLAGYFGGWFDRITGPIFDVMLALPAIIVSLSVLAVFQQSMTAAMVALGVMGSASVARVVRSATVAVRAQLFIDAAVVSGQSTPAIIFDHVTRRTAGPIIVQVALFAAFALYVQTGLTYLGLTVVPPDPTWGSMVAEAAQVIQSDGWLLVPSGGVIAFTVLAFGLVGDGARDSFVDVWSQGGSVARTRPAPAPATDEEPDASSKLSIRGLHVRLQGESGPTDAVKGISLDIRPGEVLGLVGESGSGKSMTGLAILGLLPAGGRSYGRIALDGEDLLALDPRAIARVRGKRIAMIAQEPMASLDPSVRVGVLLREVVRRHRKATRTAADIRVLDLLAAVQLPDPASTARRYPHELSGGMAQRVSIAMALAGDPELLIADEPTTALDVTVQAEVLDLLRRLQQKRNLSVLFITHNLGVVADFCERTVVMEKGLIVEDAPTPRLFAEPQHPYTQALIAATPSLLVSDGEKGSTWTTT